MNTLLGFIKKELIALLRDPALLFAILILPVIQIGIISQAITMDAHNVKLAVDSDPHDTAMQHIYEHAIGSKWFIKIKPSRYSAINAVQKDIADVALIAPSGGVLRSIERGEGQIQILINATNVLKAQSIDGYLRGIITSVLNNEASGVNTQQPIDFSVRFMFNHELKTQWFMAPALIGIQVFITILMLTSISLTREKENGTIETLISAPISKYDIILGKTIPAVLIAFFNMMLILVVSVCILKVPFLGSVTLFMIAFLIFCIPATAIGIWLSTYTSTQQQAMLGMMIITFLAMMLSGIMFPSENMPDVLQFITYINPLTHYTYLTRNIMLKDGSWLYVLDHSLILIISGIVIWYFALKRFKTTL